MRVRGVVLGLAVVVGAPLMAQSPPALSIGSAGAPIGGVVGGAPSPRVLKGKPYSLVEKTTRVQTLTDGRRLHR